MNHKCCKCDKPAIEEHYGKTFFCEYHFLEYRKSVLKKQIETYKWQAALIPEMEEELEKLNTRMRAMSVMICGCDKGRRKDNFCWNRKIQDFGGLMIILCMGIRERFSGSGGPRILPEVRWFKSSYLCAFKQGV